MLCIATLRYALTIAVAILPRSLGGDTCRIPSIGVGYSRVSFASDCHRFFWKAENSSDSGVCPRSHRFISHCRRQRVHLSERALLYRTGVLARRSWPEKATTGRLRRRGLTGLNGAFNSASDTVQITLRSFGNMI